MSETSAMTLTLVLFAVLLVSAVFVIVMGSGLATQRGHARQRSRDADPEQRKAA